MEGGVSSEAASFWQTVLTAIGIGGSFFTGAWAFARATGKVQGEIGERLNAQSELVRELQGRVARTETTLGMSSARSEANTERLVRLEERFDQLDSKLGAVGSRIAEMPTRSEMSGAFARLETRLDALRNSRGRAE